jgi:hypothetical protein
LKRQRDTRRKRLRCASDPTNLQFSIFNSGLSGLGFQTSRLLPFWPPLPRLSYYEDMYGQAWEHFPGLVLNLDKHPPAFSMDKFAAEPE